MLVLDVEGTDGREKEDQKEFEGKSALFSARPFTSVCTLSWQQAPALQSQHIRDVPVSGRHGDTAQTGTARSGTVPTRPDTVRHGPAWRGLTWLIEVRGLANRSEGSGQ